MKKEKRALIEPSLLKGTKDYLPAETYLRNKVISTLADVFGKFGYIEIETPVLTPAEILVGRYGELNERLIYTFQDKGERDIALPYDLTVPFSRYVAANYGELPMPFKRYQTSKVWRAEKPQRGRLREFIQSDVDIIGSKSPLCEAEIIKVVYDALDALDIKNIKIRLGSRKLLNDILKSQEAQSESLKKTLKLLDKQRDMKQEQLILALKKNGLKEAEKLLRFVKAEETNKETLKKLSPFDTSEIQRVIELSEKIGVPSEKIVFEPSMVRGLDYYTGVVFEVDSGSEKEICAGGRYDDLCGRFCNKDFSGVGASFGIDRIAGIAFKNEQKGVVPTSEVLVARFGDNELEENAQLRIFNLLSQFGIKAELYFDAHALSNQFKYAQRKHIPFVVMCGKNELSESKVKVKRMDSGKQKELLETQLISYLKGFYGAKEQIN